jgi:hypothetical protein
MTRTFIVGDIHGHADRLAELLDRSGVLSEGGEIILLGDVGHYDSTTHQQDLLTWQLVERLPNCTALWGNHDYANVNPTQHGFTGHDMAFPEVIEIIRRVKPVFAVERHGYVLTHAGIAPRFGAPAGTPPEIIATTLNQCEGLPAVNDISYRRGGFATQGGILWRDASEPLYDAVPQVFGHSRGDIRRFGSNLQSWCIDVATKENNELAGLWLPDRKIVAVGEDAAIYETPWEDSD